MSRVSWTPYLPGDARDITSYNTMITALETQSSDLDGTNFAQEGLELGQIAHRPRTIEFEIDETTRDATGLTSTSFADFVFSGTTFRYDTNVTLAVGQELKLRYRVMMTSRGASGGITPGGNRINFRVGIKPVASAETFHMARSIERVGASKEYGWVGATFMYQVAGEIDFIRLQYQLAGAGTIRPGYGIFYGIRQRRV